MMQHLLTSSVQWACLAMSAKIKFESIRLRNSELIQISSSILAAIDIGCSEIMMISLKSLPALIYILTTPYAYSILSTI